MVTLSPPASWELANPSAAEGSASPPLPPPPPPPQPKKPQRGKFFFFHLATTVNVDRSVTLRLSLIERPKQRDRQRGWEQERERKRGLILVLCSCLSSAYSSEMLLDQWTRLMTSIIADGQFKFKLKLTPTENCLRSPLHKKFPLKAALLAINCYSFSIQRIPFRFNNNNNNNNNNEELGSHTFTHMLTSTQLQPLSPAKRQLSYYRFWNQSLFWRYLREGSKPEYSTQRKNPDSLPVNRYHILEEKIQRPSWESNPHPPTLMIRSLCQDRAPRLTHWTTDCHIFNAILLIIFYINSTVLMMYHHTKFGCKRLKNSADLEETVKFWRFDPTLWPWPWR